MDENICVIGPDGGIGRRDGLKIHWWQHHESSILSLGTIK